ncbi:hypothetical protein [Anaeromyxobacter sp. Fw109-5]|uniref:hypothetical protein n=1 Tax=Anaeromyxobacter sp. (strain Fw109-5) TaxID=404589 RepID=UPI00030F0A5A|nr:hypothetical protein [Anaeromyxobacter sp. Fw109-5]
MGLADAVIAALVLAGAAFLLYRSLFKGKGPCHGCSSGGCGARAPAPAPLVRLGSQPRAGGEQGNPPPACHRP